MKKAVKKTAVRTKPDQETARAFAVNPAPALFAIANALNRLAAAAEIIASPPIASSPKALPRGAAAGGVDLAHKDEQEPCTGEEPI